MSLLSKRTSGGRPYVVKDISRYREDPTKLPDDCHIYYFAHLDGKHARQLVKNAQHSSILTIADSLEELRDGAMLAFIEERGKIKIYVNTRSLADSGLKIKSSLLRIAKKV